MPTFLTMLGKTVLRKETQLVVMVYSHFNLKDMWNVHVAGCHLPINVTLNGQSMYLYMVTIMEETKDIATLSVIKLVGSLEALRKD